VHADCADADLLPTAETLERVRDAVVCLQNEERAQAGLRALRQDTRLQRAATRHSQEMVTESYFAGDDDAAHAAASGPQFKVVYAFAADRPNRFDAWKDALQANVAITERFLSAQSGGRKAVRFDMGTSCGPQFVDLQVVALPGTRADYVDNFSAITGAVRAALGTATGSRNTIILADELAGGVVEYGLGETIMGASGEQAGAGNPHNRGGLSSVLCSRDGAAAPGPNARGWWPEGFLHELSHNLGAVQCNAPHSTQPPGHSDPRYGHCWQGADVMCNTEDGGAAHAMVTDCAPFGGMIAQSYDCGRDDYFNPAPDGGSYLATHWNTYDNVFLAPCTEIAPACGGGELWVPSPPAATDGPTVSGNPRRGSALKVSAGAWINRPTTYEYQWQRLTPRGWSNIDEATQARYTTASAGPRPPPARDRRRRQLRRPGGRRQSSDRADRGDRAQTELALRGNQGELKYEFRLQPGADPRAIRLDYGGANGLRTDETGALLIDTGSPQSSSMSSRADEAKSVGHETKRQAERSAASSKRSISHPAR
jgi:hypothetical protein